MKKLILAGIILMSALGSQAQEQQDHSIQVTGTSSVTREVESYQIDFSIAVDYAYGETESRKSFEDLKKSFFAKVKEAGLDESKFKEDKMGYQALRMYREGNLYTFSTLSRDELLKASQLANGTVVNITGTRAKFKPIVKTDKQFETAFRNSQEKAAMIAKAINKKLGAVVSVTDLTPQEAPMEENFYFKPIEDQSLTLLVTFSFE
ncbi:SIMPL domain-containing protein [Chitinophaga rhizophila]|uniref:SIMPL domain-containing protein n=1 Tax=Chitinophaga rhizophila TaxID=2866212 RepID=A0ABS7G5A4_9BACT|nr:SIMPL domain-containing protein [Chitinophaga rhizophila]MBW8682842.1 SIMPL domain-containing protein [Chitinophaga rhizophila]